jgi:TfoX/Sxy family transcriptional regulator of competence genes
MAQSIARRPPPSRFFDRIALEVMMAYDEILADRIRSAMRGLPGLVEKRMFGGVGYLINGNMACGIMGNDLIVRVGSERYQEALAEPFTHTFSKTGKPMTGWVMVSGAALGSDEIFREWVRRGVECASALPEK